MVTAMCVKERIKSEPHSESDYISLNGKWKGNCMNAIQECQTHA